MNAFSDAIRGDPNINMPYVEENREFMNTRSLRLI